MNNDKSYIYIIFIYVYCIDYSSINKPIISTLIHIIVNLQNIPLVFVLI